MRNRAMVRILFDTAIFLGKLNLPLRGHDESKESLNRGCFKEYLGSVNCYYSLPANSLGKNA